MGILQAADMVACKECNMSRLPKANELPLYEKSTCHMLKKNAVPIKGSLEQGIYNTRHQLNGYISKINSGFSQVSNFYNTGVAHTKNTYDYLTEEDNIFPRTVAILSGGLIGLLMGSRGGVMKKLAYSSTGIAIVSSVCYPKEFKNGIRTVYDSSSEKVIDYIKTYSGSRATSPSAIEKAMPTNSTFSFENIKETVKNWKEKHFPMEQKPIGDLGQSNPKDADLYTTRK